MSGPSGPTPEGADAPSYLAAVDLGSNSFHMVIARVVNGVPAVVDRIKEPVQLAFGLDEKGRFSEEARARALECLERFGQRIRHLPDDRVRAVGTNTLRAARKTKNFLREAEAALGHPIEIISGTEEARLIYLGIAHDLSDDVGTRLVVDIGGGSTECVLGERFEPYEAHSLYMGCIAFSARFFPKGSLRRRNFEAAKVAARAEVQTIERRFRDLGWDRAIGSSGTIRTAQTVLETNHWSERGITLDGLKKLRKAMTAAGSIKKLSLDGLKSWRAPVFPGGVAILTALFEGLGIERMEAASGALREGVMYDLLGRIRHEDVRERTIRIFQDRYNVDTGQAARVERNALHFLRQAAPGWHLDPVTAGRFLTWAARLHEVGLAIAYGHYQRHGAYILANSNMPGFSRDDQRLLAAVVAGHRRKIPLDVLDDLTGSRQDVARRLIVLLRLAVLSNRERGPHPVPPWQIEGTGDGLRIRYPRSWLLRHPLTRSDFDLEAAYLERIGINLDHATDEPQGTADGA